MKVRCCECIFWERGKLETVAGYTGMGNCHRFPECATTDEEYWCGEYRPTPEAEKKWWYGIQQYGEVNQ